MYAVNPYGKHREVEAYEAEINRSLVNNLRNHLNQAYLSPFYLDDKQFALVCEIFKPMPVNFTTHPQLHNHPIPALLQAFAYKKVIDYASNFKRAIDIGGTPLRTPNEHHLCTKIDDARTNARYLNAAVLNPEKPFSKALMTNGIPKCDRGAEKCHYKAPYGYMINVYDIPIQTIPLIMSNHNMQILDCWMFLPNVLIDERLHQDEQFYKTDVYKEKDGRWATFSFSDGATSYVHDYDNWRNYLTTTLLTCPTGAVFAEIICNLHTFCCIRFTFTDNPAGNYQRRITPYVQNKARLVEVPDVLLYYFIGNKAIDMFINSYVVEERIVKDALLYANRQSDGSFNFANFASHLDSKTSALYYAANGEQQMIYKQLDMEVEQYLSFTVSLFIICVVKRMNRTYKAGQIIGSLSNKESIWESIKHWFNKTIIDIEISCIKTFDKKMTTEDFFKRVKEDPTKIMNLTVRTWKDRVYNQTIKLKYHYKVDNKSKLPDMKEPMWVDDDDPEELPFEEDSTVSILSSSSYHVNLEESMSQLISFSETLDGDLMSSSTPRPSIASTIKAQLPPVKQEKNQPSIVSPNISLSSNSSSEGWVTTDDDENSDSTMTSEKPEFKSLGNTRNFLDMVKQALTPRKRMVSNNVSINTTIEDTRPYRVPNSVAMANYRKLVVTSIDDLGHLKITYNPKGTQGKCGLFCVAHILGVEVDKVKISTLVRDTDDWYLDTDQLAAVCKENGINCIIHTPTYDYFFDFGLKITGKFLLKGGHYTVVKCGCSLSPCFVGDYKTLQIDPNYLYVNCANSDLTDGAGQAAAFRALFPNYDKNIVKPCKTVQYTNYKGTYLCIAVAYDNRKEKNRLKTNKAFQEICTSIDLFCKKNDLCVYLPLIGTKIFKGDLCCLKHHISKMTCKKVICFYNDMEKDLYDKTQECKHGGWDDYGNFDKVQERGKYDPSNYDQLIPHKVENKQNIKAKDMVKFTRDDSVVEVSAAPGTFAKEYIKQGKRYTPLNYTGENAFSLDQNLPRQDWHDLITLGKLLLKSKAEHVLFDCPIQHALDTHLFLLKYVAAGRCAKYTTKFLTYVDKDSDINIDFRKHIEHPQLMFKLWHNVGTESMSSELFITYQQKPKHFGPQVADVDAIMQDVDESNRMAQDKLNCTCKEEIKTNGIIQIKTNELEYRTFIENLYKDHLLKDQCPPKHIKTVDKFEVIAGVAGSRKSTGILDKTCCKCALIIAPFRSVADQHRKYNNTSITFIKAINLEYTGFKYVFVDEVFSMNPYMVTLYANIFTKAKIIGLGDPKQIPPIDLDKLMPEFKVDLSGYYLRSFRCPKAVCALLEDYVPGIWSSKSITDAVTIIDKIVMDKDTFLLTHTQKNKEKYIKEFNKANIRTVHEAMGCTYQKVVIDITDFNDIIKNKECYAYVGLTRSANKTYIYGSEQQFENYLRSLKVPDPLHHNGVTYDAPALKVKAKIVKVSHNENLDTDVVPQSLVAQNVVLPKTGSKHKPLEETIDVSNKISRPDVEVDPADFAVQYVLETVKEHGETSVLGKGEEMDKFLVSTKQTADGLVKTYNVENSKIEDAITAFDITPHGDNVVVMETELTAQKEVVRQITTSSISIDTVQTILDKVYKTQNDIRGTNIIGYRDNLIKEIKSNCKITIPTQTLGNHDTEIKGGKLSENSYNRLYLGKDNKQLVDTIITRYMGTPNKLPAIAADYYYEGLCKFMKPGFKRSRQMSAEDVWASVRHYLQNLQKKMGMNSLQSKQNIRKIADKLGNMSINHESDNSAEEVVIDCLVNDKKERARQIVMATFNAMKTGNSMEKIREEYNMLIMQYIEENSDMMSTGTLNAFRELNDDWYSNRSSEITFHMKNQPKEIRGDYWDTADKVGQGISAWSKLLNCILSTMGYAFECNIKNQLLSDVALAVDASDAQISRFIARKPFLYTSNEYDRFNVDISQFDKSQNQRTVAMHCLVLKNQGFNNKAIQLLMEHRRRYRCTAMINPSFGDQLARIGFDVEWVMTSGALFTLWGNTIVNMAIIGASFDIRGLQSAIFKGDDSHIVARKITKKMHEGVLMSQFLGHELKVDQYFIGEFIANIICPHGFFPDVLRRVSRVISKVYTKPEDWDIVRQSIKDSLDVILSPEQLSLGCEIAALHYQERNLNITKEDVMALVVFMKRITYDEKIKPHLNRKWAVAGITLDF
nr:nonstructural polyprotein [Hepelivirales sp.]WAY16472.1 nonstructural polyprotein [Hepelivirales sp.]